MFGIFVTLLSVCWQCFTCDTFCVSLWYILCFTVINLVIVKTEHLSTSLTVCRQSQDQISSSKLDFGVKLMALTEAESNKSTSFILKIFTPQGLNPVQVNKYKCLMQSASLNFSVKVYQYKSLKGDREGQDGRNSHLHDRASLRWGTNLLKVSEGVWCLTDRQKCNTHSRHDGAASAFTDPTIATVNQIGRPSVRSQFLCVLLQMWLIQPLLQSYLRDCYRTWHCICLWG